MITTGVPCNRAHTAYMPNTGGVTSTASRPGSHSARTSGCAVTRTAMPSCAPPEKRASCHATHRWPFGATATCGRFAPSRIDARVLGVRADDGHQGLVEGHQAHPVLQAPRVKTVSKEQGAGWGQKCPQKAFVHGG